MENNKKKKVIIAGSIVGALALGMLTFYLASPNNGVDSAVSINEVDAPPGLVPTSNFQGYSRLDGFLRLTDADVQDYQEPEGLSEEDDIVVGPEIYYSTEIATVEEWLTTKLIKPVSGETIGLYFYSPGESLEGEYDYQQGWYSFPSTNQFRQEVNCRVEDEERVCDIEDVFELNPDSKLPKGRGVIIVSSFETESYLFANESAPDEFIASYEGIDFFDDSHSGDWIVAPVDSCNSLLAPNVERVFAIGGYGDAPDLKSRDDIEAGDCSVDEKVFAWIQVQQVYSLVLDEIDGFEDLEDEEREALIADIAETVATEVGDNRGLSSSEREQIEQDISESLNNWDGESQIVLAGELTEEEVDDLAVVIEEEVSDDVNMTATEFVSGDEPGRVVGEEETEETENGDDNLGAVENLRTTSSTPGELTVEWDAAEGADSYRLYYAQSDGFEDESDFENFIEVSGDETSFTFTLLDPSDEYTFAVRPVDAEGNEGGEFSNLETGYQLITPASEENQQLASGDEDFFMEFSLGGNTATVAPRKLFGPTNEVPGETPQYEFTVMTSEDAEIYLYVFANNSEVYSQVTNAEAEVEETFTWIVENPPIESGVYTYIITDNMGNSLGGYFNSVETQVDPVQTTAVNFAECVEQGGAVDETADPNTCMIDGELFVDSSVAEYEVNSYASCLTAGGEQSTNAEGGNICTYEGEVYNEFLALILPSYQILADFVELGDINPNFEGFGKIFMTPGEWDFESNDSINFTAAINANETVQIELISNNNVVYEESVDAVAREPFNFSITQNEVGTLTPGPYKILLSLDNGSETEKIFNVVEPGENVNNVRNLRVEEKPNNLFRFNFELDEASDARLTIFNPDGEQIFRETKEFNETTGIGFGWFPQDEDGILYNNGVYKASVTSLKNSFAGTTSDDISTVTFVVNQEVVITKRPAQFNTSEVNDGFVDLKVGSSNDPVNESCTLAVSGCKYAIYIDRALLAGEQGIDEVTLKFQNNTGNYSMNPLNAGWNILDSAFSPKFVAQAGSVNINLLRYNAFGGPSVFDLAWGNGNWFNSIVRHVNDGINQ